MSKSPNAFKTISEVADLIDVPQHVLRFWESKFSHIKPMKRGGGRRYYRPQDVELIQAIKLLLHDDGYTIKGVQKLLREKGLKGFLADYSGAEDEVNKESPIATDHVEAQLDLSVEVKSDESQAERAEETAQDKDHVKIDLSKALSELESLRTYLTELKKNINDSLSH